MSDESTEGLSANSEAERDTLKPRVVIISGMSGSGKSTAVKALEDIGYFCIDNMPVPLLPKVLELTTSHQDGREVQDYAFVIDIRELAFLDQAGAVINQMEEEGLVVDVLFLEANDEALVRRYKETRRKHPMSVGGTVREGINKERDRLNELRLRANTVIDTSTHTVHTLKALIQEQYSKTGEREMHVTVLSFGFKHGLPSECDLVFDVRFLPNPYFVEGMRPLSGLDEPVLDYVMSFSESTKFVELFNNMADFMLPHYRWEGKSYLTIGIGCTGGQHRSVAVSQVISSRLRGRGWQVTVRHRDVRIKK